MVGSSEGLEPARVQGITCDEDIARIQVTLPHASMRTCRDALERLAASGLAPREMFEHRDGDSMALTLLVGRQETSQVETILRGFLETQPGSTMQTDAEVARVAVIGHALQTPGVAGRVLAVLVEAGIELQEVQTSPLTLTGFVPTSEVDRVMHLLHEQIGPEDG